MSKIVIYASSLCPYCHWAKSLLDSKKVAYEELNVDRDSGLRQQMQQLSGRHTVPQIFIGERHIGGFDDLSALDRAGGLDPLLASLAPPHSTDS